MSELPQVGQTYKHKTHGDAEVLSVVKRGRGYQVNYSYRPAVSVDGYLVGTLATARLKDWQKATA